PTAQGIGGTATLTPGACRFHVARGMVDRLNVVRATIDMTGLDRGTPRVAVRAAVNGPVASALALARAKALAGERLGIDPADAAGGLAAGARARLPPPPPPAARPPRHPG